MGAAGAQKLRREASAEAARIEASWGSASFLEGEGNPGVEKAFWQSSWRFVLGLGYCGVAAIRLRGRAIGMADTRDRRAYFCEIRRAARLFLRNTPCSRFRARLRAVPSAEPAVGLAFDAAGRKTADEVFLERKEQNHDRNGNENGAGGE